MQIPLLSHHHSSARARIRPLGSLRDRVIDAVLQSLAMNLYVRTNIRIGTWQAGGGGLFVKATPMTDSTACQQGAETFFLQGNWGCFL